MRTARRHQSVIPARRSPGAPLSRLIALFALTLLTVLSWTPGVGARAEEPKSAAPASNSPAAIPTARQATNLVVITITGPIDPMTAQSVQRRIKEAEQAGADGIVIDLDTPGGDVIAMNAIIGAINNSSIKNSIAWVHPQALSAGSIIALSCREIIIAPGALMGDAAPIAGDPLGIGFLKGLRDTERSKALTPIAVTAIDSARAHGIDEHLVMGFITLGMELWLVEQKSTGKRFCLTKQEYKELFDRDPVATSTPIVPSLDPGKLRQTTTTSELPVPAGDPENPNRGLRVTIPSLDADGMRGMYNAATGLQNDSTRPNFASADPNDFTEISYLSDGTSLFAFKQAGLMQLGIVSAVVADDNELKQFTGATHMVRLDQTWSEDAVAFMTMGLSGMVIKGVLIVVFLLAMFIELSMPGASIPGIIALLALAGLIIPPMLVGAASWWAVASIGVGVLLILLEVFVLPGFGLPGLLGLLLLLAGLVATFAGQGELFPGQGAKGSSDLTWALTTVMLSVFAAGVGMYLFSRYTHSFPVAGRLVLGPTPRNDDENTGLLAAMSPHADTGPVKLGEVGVATTPLRPSGSAEFNEKLVDVVSEFGFVEPGTRVRVTSVNEYRVAVEPLRDATKSGGIA